jgi:HEPN domain-containing protein
MAELTPLVEAWIRYADDDWQDSQILAGAGGNPRSICFHVQQSIEKLFKAELMRLQSPVPKTQGLPMLRELTISKNAGRQPVVTPMVPVFTIPQVSTLTRVRVPR